MALTEAPTISTPKSTTVLPNSLKVDSICSYKSFTSTSDNFSKDSSYDFDSLRNDISTILPESVLSTPRFLQSKRNMEASQLGYYDSPIKPSASELDDFDFGLGFDSPSKHTNDSTANLRAQGAQTSHPTLNLNTQLPNQINSGNRNQTIEQLMSQITDQSKNLKSLGSFLQMWGQITHRELITKFAIQRDVFALSIDFLSLHTDSHLDISSFCNRYYQLRSAYVELIRAEHEFTLESQYQGSSCSSRASLGGASSAGTKTNKNCRKSPLGHLSCGSPEMPWNDRQLVNSFMTLLRTSPGFLAHAISHFTGTELAQFLENSVDGPFNVLFHGILGSAGGNRPRILAEVLMSCHSASQSVPQSVPQSASQSASQSVPQSASQSASQSVLNSAAVLNPTQQRTLLNSCLNTYLQLTLSTFSKRASKILENLVSQRIDNPCLNTLPMIHACIPHELQMFLHFIMKNEHFTNDLETVVLHFLKNYVQILLLHPHMFSTLPGVYLSNTPLHEFHQSINEEIYLEILNKIKCQSYSYLPTSLWSENEYIVIRGSDIILLFNSLLPFHLETDFDLRNDISGEWCLESIRADLAPVITELKTHIALFDGWQVFKLDNEGLITDMDPSLNLDLNVDSSVESMSSETKLLCDVFERYKVGTFAERLQLAKMEAELTSDFWLVKQLSNCECTLKSANKALTELSSSYNTLAEKRENLFEIQASLSGERNKQETVIMDLIETLDHLRIQVWYELEIRGANQFGKSKEMLKQLMVNSTLVREDGDVHSHSNGHSNGHSHSHSSTSVNAASPQQQLQSDTSSYHRIRSPSLSSVSSTSKKKYNRRSFLGSYTYVESPFYNLKVLPCYKLTDKDVELVTTFMSKLQVKNFLPSEEIFHRGLTEISNLAFKLLDQDHFPNYTAFKKDKYRTSNDKYSKPRYSKSSSKQSTSSLTQGLFNLFDHDSNVSQPLLLHTTPSSHVLNMAKSSQSLHRTRSSLGETHNNKAYVPPIVPNMEYLASLILTDIGVELVYNGTETDKYVNSIGNVLLDGDSSEYSAVFKDISTTITPEMKLTRLENLVKCVSFSTYPRSHDYSYAGSHVGPHTTHMKPYMGPYTRPYTGSHMSKSHDHNQNQVQERDHIVLELSKIIGREPGTIFADLQIISHLVSPEKLAQSSAFNDVFRATKIVMQSVMERSIEYATRLSNYIEETLPNSTAITAGSGIADTFHIWSFCARYGNVKAQAKLVELYYKYKYVPLEMMPLSKPGVLFASGFSGNSYRSMILSHWQAQMGAHPST